MNQWGGSWGWNQAVSSSWIATTNSTSGNAIPWAVYAQPQPLPSVAEPRRAFAQDRELTGREWLEWQISEVCELAAAA